MSALVDVNVYLPNAATLICNVPKHKGASWLEEVNGDGAATVQIHLDDPVFTAHPTVNAGNNILKLTLPGGHVVGGVVEDDAQVQLGSGEKADRMCTLTGRGPRSVLSCATVWPEYALRAHSPAARAFDFSSADGPWRISADWAVPLGFLQSGTGVRRSGSPAAWPDPLAQWIWTTDPNADTPAGRQWFRSNDADFTLGATTTVRVWASADNQTSVRIDGEEIVTTDPTNAYNWQQTFTTDIILAAGVHTLAAWVDNIPWAATNPAAFLSTVGTVDSQGKLVTVLLRTTPASFKVHDYGNDPGWHGAQILVALIAEAQARGVNALTALTLSFTGLLDTAGNAWTNRQARTFNVTDDLLDVLNQISALEMDVEVTPNLVLNAWLRRGTDRSGTVTLGPLLSCTPGMSYGPVRNDALVRGANGWNHVTDSASVTAHGRRETGLTVGSADNTTQAAAVGVAHFGEVSAPQQTLTVTFSSAAGPQPHIDWFLGDTVMCLGLNGALIAARAMSIAGVENEQDITWTVVLYPVA